MESFRSINRIYYRGSHGVGFVFDLNNKNSLDSVEQWVVEFLNYMENKEQSEVSFLLLGNKSDLLTSRHSIND